MDILADQVVAGSALRAPRWVGPWRLLGSDLSGGNARLLVDPDPGYPSGFVRAGPSRPQVASEALNLDLHLWGRWWYEEED